VARAIDHEISRQVALIESGGKVVQETRLWNADRSETASMRSKEEAHDYRYFPEPDLPPLVVGTAWVDEVRASLPELPAEKRRRFVSEYGLPDYDAGVLTLARDVADYFEAVAKGSGNAKTASNWVMNEVLRKLKDGDIALADCRIRPDDLGELIKLIVSGAISGKIAKDVFEKMWASGDGAKAIVEREGLTQVSDTGALEAAIKEVLAQSPDQVATYKKGKTGTIGWFVGQVMKKTGGKANPALVNELLKKALDS